MTKLSNNDFGWRSGAKWSVVREPLSATTEFVNLKNKAEGVRRYGYTTSVSQVTNTDGRSAFRGEYQTTLNGMRYQSGKYTDWYTTADEVEAHLAKTIKGALKRYEKLAQDPASRIEKR